MSGFPFCRPDLLPKAMRYDGAIVAAGQNCLVMRQGDEMTCRCGMRWDVGEPSPCSRLKES